MQHEEGVPLATSMLIPLTWFWYRYGYLQEGTEWTERAVVSTAEMGDSPLRAYGFGGARPIWPYGQAI